MLEELKQEVYEANMQLPKLGLVSFTWGNVSGIDREKGLYVIKPSGVPYDELKPEDMVVVNLKGEVVEGDMNPSSDTPTHTYLYNHFPKIGGIVHTHSPWAVSFAAANMDVPALNTTHADTFYTDVPAADALTKEEIEEDYEGNTGKTIVRTFKERGLDYEAYHAMQLTRQNLELPQYLLDKHYYRKHGANAYYGQNNAHSKDHAKREN